MTAQGIRTHMITFRLRRDEFELLLAHMRREKFDSWHVAAREAMLDALRRKSAPAK